MATHSDHSEADKKICKIIIKNPKPATTTATLTKNPYENILYWSRDILSSFITVQTSCYPSCKHVNIQRKHTTNTEKSKNDNYYYDYIVEHENIVYTLHTKRYKC